MDETPTRLKLDPVGIFYISLCGSWTVLVLMGMGYLWHRRDMPLLKIRGLGLTFVAISMLHVYWMLVQFGYVITPFSSQVQYWVMGIWLPCGFALFHASNSRFLHVAKQQRRFAQGDASRPPAREHRKPGFFAFYHRMSYNRKIITFVGSGMVVQMVLIVVMYLLSRKFHPSFGVPGTEVSGNPWEVNQKQTIGWEWWPSLVWQFLWAWIVAPVVLWRARRIQDTLGWRTQTILCCIASLPATPMWLIALYVPGMAKVNQYWIPPQWIAVSLMMLEICSIFLPCWEAYKHQVLRQETLDTIAAWQAKQGNLDQSTVVGSATPTQKSWLKWSIAEKTPASSTKGSVSTNLSNESLHSMGALERTLASDPEPLRKFSALNDFSGENVAFLTSVAEWKKTFSAGLHEENRRDAYIRALVVYHEFVSPSGAEFPVNLSYQELAELDTTFKKAAEAVYGDKGPMSPIHPFVAIELPRYESTRARLTSESEGRIIPSRPSSDHASYWGNIPTDFSINVFDHSEHSIKYLVLTNTWPKFIQRRRSSETSQTSSKRDTVAWIERITSLF